MFDTALQQINNFVGITIGGVSIVSVIGMAITLIVEIRNSHKEARLTKQAVETSFQNAVLPTKIKIDLSNKIQEPIEKGFLEVNQYLRETVGHIEKGEKLILTILSQFSHVNKLPISVQSEIEEYLDDSKTVEVKFE